MTEQANNDRRQGSDQELAAVEATSNLVQQMTDYLFRQEAQWNPEPIEKLSAAMLSGNASLRVIFDLDTAGLVSLKIFGCQPQKPPKRIFDIAPVRKQAS